MPGGNGDPPDDYDQCFRELWPWAYNVGLRFFRNRDQAEEVAQETMVRAYVHWPAVRRHERPEAWIVRTATNVALEQSRKNERFRRPHAQSETGDPATSDNLGDAQLLVKALRKLSRRQRRVMVWRFCFDASVEETSEMLGMSESQVKDATHEAKKKLRRMLGDEYPGLSE